MVQALDIMQETRTFTVREIFEAIKQNGFEHLREQWFSYNPENKAIGGCVLGQAGLNLGIPVSPEGEEENADNLWAKLNNFNTPEKWIDKLNPEFTKKAGEAIVFWNDHHEYDEHGDAAENDAGEYVWTLPTYKEVVEMAREILEPYFNETIELPHFEY